MVRLIRFVFYMLRILGWDYVYYIQGNGSLIVNRAISTVNLEDGRLVSRGTYQTILVVPVF